jgi:hypothetical protein
MPLTKGLSDVLLSHPCPHCGKQDKKGSWLASIPVRPAIAACELPTMIRSVFSRRTLIGRSCNIIRRADRRAGIGTLDRSLAALLIVLALAGCAAVAAVPGQVPNAPYQQSDPRDTSGMH